MARARLGGSRAPKRSTWEGHLPRHRSRAARTSPRRELHRSERARWPGAPGATPRAPTFRWRAGRPPRPPRGTAVPRVRERWRRRRRALRMPPREARGRARGRGQTLPSATPSASQVEHAPRTQGERWPAEPQASSRPHPLPPATPARARRTWQRGSRRSSRGWRSARRAEGAPARRDRSPRPRPQRRGPLPWRHAWRVFRSARQRKRAPAERRGPSTVGHPGLGPGQRPRRAQRRRCCPRAPRRDTPGRASKEPEGLHRLACPAPCPACDVTA